MGKSDFRNSLVHIYTEDAVHTLHKSSAQNNSVRAGRELARKRQETLSDVLRGFSQVFAGDKEGGGGDLDVDLVQFEFRISVFPRI